VVVIDLPQVALDPLQNGGGTTTTSTGTSGTSGTSAGAR
jgi:hypothetical protein